MKNFIKFLTIILVVACVFSLTACRPQKDKNQNTNGVVQTTSAPTPTSFDLPDEDVFLPEVTATPGATGGAGNTPSQTQKPNVTTGANATPTPTPNQNVSLPFDPFD